MSSFTCWPRTGLCVIQIISIRSSSTSADTNRIINHTRTIIIFCNIYLKAASRVRATSSTPCAVRRGRLPSGSATVACSPRHRSSPSTSPFADAAHGRRTTTRNATNGMVTNANAYSVASLLLFIGNFSLKSFINFFFLATLFATRRNFKREVD